METAATAGRPAAAPRDLGDARRAMVDSQLRPCRVRDETLLATMAEIPRELFVPEDGRDLAYVDEDMPIGGGRLLMEPAVFARMVQEAGIGPGDVVLDLGCGTGYSAIVLGRMARAVVAVDSLPEMTAEAARIGAELGQDNVVFETGPLADGWPDQAPYDVVFVDGAVRRVPDALAAQLAPGGRLCAVERPDEGPGRAVLVVESGGCVSRRRLFDANVPLLPEFAADGGFVF